VKSSQAYAAIIVLAVGAVVIVNGQSFQNGYPAVGYPSQAYANSANGLRLFITVNSTSLAYGQRILIAVSEVNTLSAQNNVSRAQSWGVEGLRADACYASVYPFGVAIYQGRYTQTNISQAKPMQIFPLVPCPMLIRFVSGYSFLASGDLALVLPAAGAPVPMETRVVAAGNYSAVYQGGAQNPVPFAPGTYTVVAGDEWGALAFVQFQVSGASV
jgi:hypothetical protein